MSEPSVKALALPAAPTPEQYPRVYVAGGLDVFYQQVREQVLSEVPDLNSKAGIARAPRQCGTDAKSCPGVQCGCGAGFSRHESPYCRGDDDPRRDQ